MCIAPIYLFILSIVIALIIFYFMNSKEGFQNPKMRPWFGYEPGYGPGWGRKGCCNQA
jgi:hypothetical protein